MISKYEGRRLLCEIKHEPSSSSIQSALMGLLNIIVRRYRFLWSQNIIYVVKHNKGIRMKMNNEENIKQHTELSNAQVATVLTLSRNVIAVIDAS